MHLKIIFSQLENKNNLVRCIAFTSQNNLLPSNKETEHPKMNVCINE